MFKAVEVFGFGKKSIPFFEALTESSSFCYCFSAFLFFRENYNTQKMYECMNIIYAFPI